MPTTPSTTRSQKSKNQNSPIFIGITFFTALAAFVIYKPCPSDAQFILFKVMVALAAGMLAPLLTGFINVRYNKSIAGITLDIVATAGFGIFFLVGFFLANKSHDDKRCEESFTYTFFLVDKEGQSPLKSKGFLKIAELDRRLPIDDRGYCTFRTIPAVLRDSMVALQIEESNIWYFDSKAYLKMVKLSGESRYIGIQVNRKFCSVSGFVQSAAGRVVDASVCIGKHCQLTDSSGYFKVSVPENEAEIYYKITASKGNYEGSLEDVPGGTIDQVIFLQKKN